MRKAVLLILVLAMLTSFSYAKEVSMKVPAVILYENGTSKGTMSTLTLDVIPGKGRVFVSAMPLSQTDTQASARIANKVACELTGVDCSKYDFLYSLSSQYGVVGGPSAGAAMAVLTISALSGETINKSITITGTINFDGSIGVVGSIEEKAKAARDDGLQVILVPKVEETNVSGIKVVGVRDIKEAYSLFVGKSIEEGTYEVNYTDYNTLMNITAHKLFGEYDLRYKWLSSSGINISDEVIEHYNQTKALLDEGRFYSASSYSIRGIIECMELLNKHYNNSGERINTYSKLLEEYKKKVKNIKELDSVSDIEVLLALKDRIHEAEDILLDSNETEYRKAALFEARVLSIKYWYESLDYFTSSTSFYFDESRLRPLSELKITEARDAIVYAKTILGLDLSEADNILQKAGKLYLDGDYLAATSKAVEAKAIAGLYLELYGLENTSLILDYKMMEAQRYISIAQRQGITPVLAMSYLEYARTLKEDRDDSALLYASYSKEFALVSKEIASYSYTQVGYKNIDKRYGWILLSLILALLAITYIRTKH